MKLTIFLLLAVAATNSAYGQCPSNKRQLDISVSYGVISTDQVFGVANDDGATVSGQKTLTNTPGSPFITARYFFFNRLAFGLACGVLSESGKYVDTYNPLNTPGTYSKHTTVAAFEVYYIYMFRKNMELYTLAGIGPSFSNTNIDVNQQGGSSSSTNAQTLNVMKVQYTPIGIRYGGKLGAYAEVGIGYKGVFNAGVSYKLGPGSWWKE